MLDPLRLQLIVNLLTLLKSFKPDLQGKFRVCLFHVILFPLLGVFEWLALNDTGLRFHLAKTLVHLLLAIVVMHLNMQVLA